MIGLDIQVRGITKARAFLNGAAAKFPRALRMAMKAQALEYKRIVQTGIRRQAPGGKKFVPLAESTIKMKGSSKALINNGDLLRSINVNELAGLASQEAASFFVGVHRTTKSKDGKSLANIAEIHEFGSRPYKIPVTPKLRRWWFVMMREGIFNAPLSPSTQFINHPGVPARPYLRPAFEEWSRGADRRLQRDILRRLGI